MANDKLQSVLDTINNSGLSNGATIVSSDNPSTPEEAHKKFVEVQNKISQGTKEQTENSTSQTITTKTTNSQATPQNNLVATKQPVEMSPAQKVVALSVVQQYAPGSSKFQGLVAQRLFEESQKVTQPIEATVTVLGGKYQASATVMPPAPKQYYTTPDSILPKKASDITQQQREAYFYDKIYGQQMQFGRNPQEMYMKFKPGTIPYTEQIIKEGMISSNNPAAKIGGGIVLGSLYVAEPAIGAVQNPLGFAKSAVMFPFDVAASTVTLRPQGQVKAMISDFTENPVKASLNTVGTWALFKTIGYAGGKAIESAKAKEFVNNVKYVELRSKGTYENPYLDFSTGKTKFVDKPYGNGIVITEMIKPEGQAKLTYKTETGEVPFIKMTPTKAFELKQVPIKNELPTGQELIGDQVVLTDIDISKNISTKDIIINDSSSTVAIGEKVKSDQVSLFDTIPSEEIEITQPIKQVTVIKKTDLKKYYRPDLSKNRLYLDEPAKPSKQVTLGAGGPFGLLATKLVEPEVVPTFKFKTSTPEVADIVSKSPKETLYYFSKINQQERNFNQYANDRYKLSAVSISKMNVKLSPSVKNIVKPTSRADIIPIAATQPIIKPRVHSSIRSPTVIKTDVVSIANTDTALKEEFKIELKTQQESKYKFREPNKKTKDELIDSGFMSPKQPNVFNFSKLYKVTLGSGNKERTIATGLPEGKALKLGSLETLKTLRAKFSIKEIGATYGPANDISFKPDTRFFKESRTIRGQEVFTPGQFIQKRGTRLSTSTEIKEIQTARKLRMRPLMVGV